MISPALLLAATTTSLANPLYTRLMWISAGALVLLLVALVILLARGRRWWRWAGAAALALLCGVALVVGAYSAWFNHGRWHWRSNLGTHIVEAGPGIDASRNVVLIPGEQPLAYSIAQVRLPDCRVIAAGERAPVGGGSLHNFIARTPSELLRSSGANLIVNGDFFTPWRDKGPFDYYPHSGDGVDSRGLTVQGGKVVAWGDKPEDPRPALVILDDGTARIAGGAELLALQPRWREVVSGWSLLWKGGVAQEPAGAKSFVEGRHPRTAVGVNQDGTLLGVLVADGRQPNYSRGLTWRELQNLTSGWWDALILDGGGSTTMAVQPANAATGALSGYLYTVNSPIHNTMPGRERPVVNGIAIFARDPTKAPSAPTEAAPHP